MWSSGLRHQDLNKVILQVCGSIPSPAQYFFIKLIFHELLFSFLKFIKNIFMFLIAYFQFFWKISSFQTSANKFIYQWYFKSIKVGPSNFYSGKLWIDLPSTPGSNSINIQVKVPFFSNPSIWRSVFWGPLFHH